jgi:hypothetical protein
MATQWFLVSLMPHSNVVEHRGLLSKEQATPTASRVRVLSGHPSFQRVPAPPTLVVAAREAAPEAPERGGVVDQAFYKSVPGKEPKRVSSQVRPVVREPARLDRSLVARQVTEALLLGDILLEPRSRGR